MLAISEGTQYMHILCFYYFPLIWFRYWKSALQNTDFCQHFARWKPPWLPQVSCMIYFYYRNGCSSNTHQYGSFWSAMFRTSLHCFSLSLTGWTYAMTMCLVWYISILKIGVSMYLYKNKWNKTFLFAQPSPLWQTLVSHLRKGLHRLSWQPFFKTPC